MSNLDFSQLKPEIEKANDIFVLIPQNPNLDQVAGALALYGVLRSLGKNVIVACPAEMRVEFSRLVGVDKVVNKVGNRNLVISFDYVKDAIEKVSYNIEGNKFNLVIQPKAGQKPLDSESVSYSYSGAIAELVLVVGASRLEDLGYLYEEERKLYNEATTVSINRLRGTPFAKINLVDPQASSISEIVFELLKELNFQVRDDLASNLLAGIDYATNKFQSPIVSANTFAVASELLKLGAKRQLVSGMGARPFIAPRPRLQTPQSIGAQPAFRPMPAAVSAQTAPEPDYSMDKMAPSASRPITIGEQSNEQRGGQTQSVDQPMSGTGAEVGGDQMAPDDDQSVPDEWLQQPRVFKGSTKI